MMTFAKEVALRKFTDEHEWLELNGDIVTVGITKYAADMLGDLVFIELPNLGVSMTKGSTAAVVESVKAASDVYAPISGEIVACNGAIVADPALVNKDPQGEGWLFKIKIQDRKEFDVLLDEQAYQALFH